MSTKSGDLSRGLRISRNIENISYFYMRLGSEAILGYFPSHVVKLKAKIMESKLSACQHFDELLKYGGIILGEHGIAS